MQASPAETAGRTRGLGDQMNPQLRSYTLRVHVPKWGILGPQSPYIGGTLRPKYSLFRYMDP